MQRINRRRFLLTTAGLGMASAWALPGCGGSSEPSAAPAAASPSLPPPPLPAPPPASGNTTSASTAVVTRSPFTPVYVETEIKNPALYGWSAGPGIWINCKHVRFVEYNGYLYQHSGDYTGFPSQQRPDYPPNDYWHESQRQDMWRASLTPNSNGRIEWELSQNYYHNYPWNGSSGRLTPEPQRGPFMPDAFGWVVDKRGDFWSGPWGPGYTGVTGDAAGFKPDYGAMFKWNLPGVHTNGIRLGDGWTLPTQDRLGIDVRDAPRASGRTHESAYDPVTDAIYVVGHDYDNVQKTVTIQLRKFSCVPVNGKHSWTAIPIPASLAALGAPATFTSANVTVEHSNVAIAGRLLCYPFLCEYGVPAGTGNAGVARDALRKTQIVTVNLDTLTVSSIPMPSSMPWWVRTWDGPEKELGVEPGVTGEKRVMRAVRDRLVLGPDGWHKIGVDPWVVSYDFGTNTWTAFDPPTTHDWPNTLGGMASVPSLGEVWLIGNFVGLDQAETAFRNAHGLQVSLPTSGRRIVRFRIV